MSMWLAQLVVAVFELYAVAGCVFAMMFLPAGIARLDSGVTTAPKTLRLLLLPGVVALWPLFASRWIRGPRPPVERTSHRELAR